MCAKCFDHTQAEACKNNQKNLEVQLIIIPECHLFQSLQASGK